MMFGDLQAATRFGFITTAGISKLQLTDTNIYTLDPQSYGDRSVLSSSTVLDSKLTVLVDTDTYYGSIRLILPNVWHAVESADGT